jgi:RNA polymerase sigma factor (sigma-70 family)
MIAMVLGTALSAFSPSQLATAQTSDATLKAIGDMGRYCTTCWRNANLPLDSWTDCTQEVFRRLLERVPSEQWNQVLQADGEERREFVRAIDTVKKRTQRARKWSNALDNLPDHRALYAGQVQAEREVVNQAAEEVLSPRQQRILQLSFEGCSAADIAHELEMPVERVSDEKYKAIRKLRAHLNGSEREEKTSSALSA